MLSGSIFMLVPHFKGQAMDCFRQRINLPAERIDLRIEILDIPAQILDLLVDLLVVLFDFRCQSDYPLAVIDELFPHRLQQGLNGRQTSVDPSQDKICVRP
jgi:hypothetical protein